MPKYPRDDIIKTLKALAHPVRFEIIEELTKEPRMLNKIAPKFAISKSTLTGHLDILEKAGLLSRGKLGNHRYLVLRATRLKLTTHWFNKQNPQWQKTMGLLAKHLAVANTVDIVESNRKCYNIRMKIYKNLPERADFGNITSESLDELTFDEQLRIGEILEDAPRRSKMNVQEKTVSKDEAKNGLFLYLNKNADVDLFPSSKCLEMAHKNALSTTNGHIDDFREGDQPKLENGIVTLTRKGVQIYKTELYPWSAYMGAKPENEVTDEPARRLAKKETPPRLQSTCRRTT